jgi:hypothetical protein
MPLENLLSCQISGDSRERTGPSGVGLSCLLPRVYFIHFRLETLMGQIRKDSPSLVVTIKCLRGPHLTSCPTTNAVFLFPLFLCSVNQRLVLL